MPGCFGGVTHAWPALGPAAPPACQMHPASFSEISQPSRLDHFPVCVALPPKHRCSSENSMGLHAAWLLEAKRHWVRRVELVLHDSTGVTQDQAPVSWTGIWWRRTDLLGLGAFRLGGKPVGAAAPFLGRRVRRCKAVPSRRLAAADGRGRQGGRGRAQSLARQPLNGVERAAQAMRAPAVPPQHGLLRPRAQNACACTAPPHLSHKPVSR